MTRKQYDELVKKWNPSMVLHIHYETKHARGSMEMSIAFFIEKYKKIIRVFKGCRIVDCSIIDYERGVVRKHFESLEEVYHYDKGI